MLVQNQIVALVRHKIKNKMFIMRISSHFTQLEKTFK